MAHKDSKRRLALDELFDEDETRHPNFDELPDPLVLVGHELGNWAQRSMLDGSEETAELYTQYRELLKDGDQSRLEMIDELEQKDTRYSDIVSTGLQAIEGYLDILRDQDPGSVELDNFLNDMCESEDVLDNYDRDQQVVGNEALFIPFHTMVKNSKEHFERDMDELNMRIEGEETSDNYILTYTCNGSEIPEEVRTDMYDWNLDDQSTGLPTASEIIKWAGGDIEYYEGDGRYGHQITLDKP